MTASGTEVGVGTEAGATTVEFAMPSLGADMDAGTIIEWRVGAGDRVNRGDLVALVETDKADIDIEVWHTGTVTKILVEPGTEVPVGTPLALLDIDGGPEPAEPSSVPSVSASTKDPNKIAPGPVAEVIPPNGPTVTAGPAQPAQARPEQPRPVQPRTLTGAVAPSVPASPLARRLAAEKGIDLTTITPSGPGGAVLARDLAPDDPTANQVVEPEPKPSDRMRSAIADLMARSKRDIPHYYLAQEIDLDAAMTWLEATNAERPVKERILPSALLLKAVALATASNPGLNGFWIGDRFRPGDGVHLGVAVSLRGGGLVAPAIHDADGRTVAELMEALRDVVGRARSGRLRGSEMTDSTLTVSNLGDRGVSLIAGVIYPPQVALVGLGRIALRPMVVDGQVVARPQVTATLSADHRASDGQLGARYLTTIDRLLQKPEQL